MNFIIKIRESWYFILLQGSYAEDNFDLRIAGGPYIYKGFMIKGTVNILGWEIYAHVQLSDEVKKTIDFILQKIPRSNEF